MDTNIEAKLCSLDNLVNIDIFNNYRKIKKNQIIEILDKKIKKEKSMTIDNVLGYRHKKHL